MNQNIESSKDNEKLSALTMAAIERTEEIYKREHVSFKLCKKDQKERIIESTVNLSAEIARQSPNIGNRLFPACLAMVTGCYWQQTENFARTEAATAAALWMRDELMRASFSANRLQEIIAGEIEHISSKKSLKCTELFYPEGSLSAFSEIVANRFGQSQMLYSDLKEAIPKREIQKAKDIFMDRLLAFIKMELKVAKLCLLKIQGDVEDSILEDEAVPECVCCALSSARPKISQTLLHENDRNPSSIIFDTIGTLLFLPLFSAGALNAQWFGDIQRRLAEIVSEFDPIHTSDGSLVDPCTILTGFQFFWDEDSDWTFLAGPCNALLEIYGDMLPWNSSVRENEKKSKLPEWCTNSNNFFARNIWIPEKNTDGNVGMYISPAQAVYDQTRLILTNEDMACMQDKFAIPVSEDNIQIMVDTLKLVAGKTKYMKDYYAETPCLKSKEQPGQTEENEESCEALTSEIEKLREELKRTKKNLKASEHEKSEYKKEIKKTQAENEDLLQKLRVIQTPVVDIVSDNQNSAMKLLDQVQFPYVVKKKTIIFGGQESWRRAMSAKVKNVIFAPMTKRVNSDLIRTAETIWIQPNAFTHAAFHTLSDIAKRNDIPIYFFGTGGAAHCAEQLADVDFYGDDDDYDFKGLAYGCS